MNEHIEKLLKDRYYLKNETSWGDIAKRLTGLYPPMYEYILNMDFLYSSPTLMNYCENGERRGTFSSCFPMNIKDSIEGIFESLKECAIVTKYSGGVGYVFSLLRSSMEGVKGIGGRNSSGALPFISIFNETLNSVSQGGARRGAGMAQEDIEYPDIIFFINAKKESESYERFNFSVRIPNDFYKDLKKNPDKVFQVKDINNNFFDLKQNDKEISVKQLWDLIIENAWSHGEPGVFNRDIAYERCAVTNVNNTVLGNPCFTGDTLIAVADGRNAISIKQLANESKGKLKIPVYCARKNKRLSLWKTEIKNSFVFKTGEKKIITIKLSNGDFFRCTEDHLLALPNGEYIKAKNSLNLELQKFYSFLPSQDGKKYRHINSISNGFSKQHRLIWEFYKGTIKKGYVIDHREPNGDDNIENLQLLLKEDHNKKTGLERIGGNNGIHKIKNNEYYRNNRRKVTIGENNPRYKGVSDLEIIELAKKLKQENKDINIENLRNLNKNVPTGFSKNRFEGKISVLRDIVNGLKEYKEIKEIKYIDWKLKEKNRDNEVKEKLKKSIYVVEIIDNNEIEDVYDLKVEDNNNFFIITSGDKNYKNSEGILVHNCNEYISIPYSSCNLGSINLSNLINEENNFDWIKFEELIIHSVRGLNNIIDKNIFPLEKIKEVTLKIRPIGLGMMGLAHLFYKLKIPYNSKKAIKLTEDITKYLTLKGMEESVELAKEEGAYDAFDCDLFLKANERFFKEKNFKNIDVEKLKKDIKKYGIRNSGITSIAPTGTIATLVETSGGIEPVFALVYNRRIEKSCKEYDIMPIVDIEFDCYLNENFDKKEKEKIIEKVIENNGSCRGIKEIPEEMQKVFVVANDITPYEHLDILEVVAQSVSYSVSKTINLPTTTTKEDISNIYLEAFKRGIIGVTVFRSGSRNPILYTKDNNESIIEKPAPERPKKLPCHVYKIKVHGEDWRVFIGLLDGHPFEVFTGKVDLVDLPSGIEDGYIVKLKSGTYQFEHNDEILIKDIKKLFESGVQEALTRQISSNLKHGTPVEYIIEQLQKSHGTIADFNKAILRALKRYMKNIKSKNLCPECRSELIFKEGCEYCVQCSWSKCI